MMCVCGVCCVVCVCVSLVDAAAVDGDGGPGR